MKLAMQEKVAFITGGTSGIGLATARAFAREGARVVISGRDETRGREAEKSVGEACVFLRADVADEASIAEAVRQVVERFGRLHFAINAAGHGGDLLPLERTSQEVFDEVFRVNARGVFIAMRHEVNAMLAGGGGVIVNVSSVYGMVGKPSHHAYVASKHAVIGMTRSVALEYAQRGIRVNALCPGVTRTPSMAAAEAAHPALVDALVGAHPMGRMATEEEIAQSALFLCSDGAGFVTGSALAVDGGLLAA
jgi:NAD(P)-dependent dehydrogenase (short-subunit alcohol dehydrogenase family)